MTPEELEQLQHVARLSGPAPLAHYLTRDLPVHDADKFQWPPHVDLLSRKITEAAMGRCPRLIISMPPRHGKTTMLAQWGPLWLLECFPQKRVIYATHTSDLSEKSGRWVRDAIDRYSAHLNVRVSPKSSSASEWETTARGGMKSVGVGGPLTGFGADLLVMDDLIKDSKEANSETIRNNVWEWFQTTAMTRLEPKGAAIVVFTRWHPDDPIGRLIRKMNEEGGERWEVINLPALAEGSDILGRTPGEPLWPQRFDVQALHETKRGRGSYVFNALYQGRPSAAEGGYFKRSWFEDRMQREHVLPDSAYKSVVRYWDLAGTVEGEKGNTDPDWTVGAKLAITKAGVVHWLDTIRVRQSPNNVELLVQRTAKHDGPRCKVRMMQDPGQAGKQQVLHYARHVLFGYDFRGSVSNVDKLSRSGPFNAACERGDVKLVSAPWNEEVVDELCAFPNGTHDDIVDAAVGAYGELAGQGREWDQDAMRDAFSYNRAKKAQQSVAELLIQRRAVPGSLN